MAIDTTACGTRPSGYGTWVFNGPRGQQVAYSGWWGDARAYLLTTYGGGRWTVEPC